MLQLRPTTSYLSVILLMHHQPFSVLQHLGLNFQGMLGVYSLIIVVIVSTRPDFY